MTDPSPESFSERHPLLSRVLRRPWLIFGMGIEFFVEWRHSRNLRALFWSLPAIGIAVTVLGIAVWFHLKVSEADVIVEYTKAAHSALRIKDYQKADVYFRRLAFLENGNPDITYFLALTAQQNGDSDRARHLMQQIAPINGAGHPGAHFWLASEMQSENSTLTSEEADAMEHHLKQTIADNADSVEAHALLGRLYLSRNDLELAIRHLRVAVTARPQWLFTLAQAYAVLGSKEAALDTAQRASDFYAGKTQESRSDADSRIKWARCQQFLRNHEQAVSILQAGRKESPEHAEQFESALVTTYVSWSKEPGATSPARQLELLDRALEFGPDHPHVLTRLAELATTDADKAEEARDRLRDSLARGVAPATAHLILGSWALSENDLQTGVMHLELAYQKNPRIPSVLNNLAWGIAHNETPDLERALQLVEQAHRMSQHPEILETRGVILARKGEYARAVTDLEAALRAFPGRIRLHKELAHSYEQLGDPDMAARHRGIAEQGSSAVAEARS